MNSLQKARCLIVGMVVATMATPLMAFIEHSNYFWIQNVSNDMRQQVSQVRMQSAAVAHPEVRRPIVHVTVSTPALGSPAWNAWRLTATRMLAHAQGQFGPSGQ